MGYIAKVWKEWLIDIYGSNNRRKRNLSPGNQLSSEGIEKIINDKRGGKREGAGSKRKIGYSIPTIRILARIKENIQCYIDVYSHYYKDDEIPYQ